MTMNVTKYKKKKRKKGNQAVLFLFSVYLKLDFHLQLALIFHKTTINMKNNEVKKKMPRAMNNEHVRVSCIPYGNIRKQFYPICTCYYIIIPEASRFTQNNNNLLELNLNYYYAIIITILIGNFLVDYDLL